MLQKSVNKSRFVARSALLWWPAVAVEVKTRTRPLEAYNLYFLDQKRNSRQSTLQFYGSSTAILKTKRRVRGHRFIFLVDIGNPVLACQEQWFSSDVQNFTPTFVSAVEVAMNVALYSSKNGDIDICSLNKIVWLGISGPVFTFRWGHK